MTFGEKLQKLRKEKGWTQEQLAAQISISRQALSKWELGTAIPDTENVVQLSKLFQVSTDYLLNDEYESDNDLPKVKEVKSNGLHQIIILLITLEVMTLVVQFIATFILQNVFWSVLSFLPFVAIIGGFEYSFQKNSHVNETAVNLRKKFYKISAWLGAYFPIRLLMKELSTLYPRPYSSIVLETLIIVLYFIVATAICLLIGRNNKN